MRGPMLTRRAARAVVVGVAVGACSAPAREPAPVRPDIAAPADAAIDAPAPSQDEILAAIQKAMNELDEATAACWAAAAVERFDVEGELVARIEVPAGGGPAAIGVIRDGTNSPRLARCVTDVLAAYPWAPPLHGQALQLPFRFRAPAGQSVIDRRLVPAAGQGGVAIGVLLDDANTGNDAASLLEVAIDAGHGTGLRVAERAELWYFLTPALVAAPGAPPRPVPAGDMMFVAAGRARDVRAATAPARAVLAIVPGGREGAARAGALPTPAPPSTRPAPAGPRLLPASAARTHGPATLFAEPATIGAPTLAASLLALPAGATVAAHVHATETELLYVLEGSGTMTVAGVALAVTPTSVIQVPPNTPHAFTAAAPVRAVQIYTPAGPEQRFKKGAP